MKTTIGIDIRMLARGSKTGVEEYTSRLLENMLGIDGQISFKLFYNGWKKNRLDYEWLGRPNVELCEFGIPNRLLDAAVRFSGFPKIDALLGGTDIFFSPHIFLAPVSPRCRKAVTFHDLSFEKYPEFYSSQKNLWHFSMAPRLQAEGADRIIAVSDSTRQDLIDAYGVPAEKIRVIYSGLSPDAGRSVSSEEKIRIREKYGLPENYVLYLGTLEPRKNIVSLLNAFEGMKKDGAFRNFDFKLVIAGAKGWLYEDIFNTARNLSSKKDIVFTGFVREEDKPALYAMSKLFVYPSFYEGFGFPVLEAMAQGAPVITSNISSLPEAAGNAAIMVNPANTDELLRAMEKVLGDAKLSQKLSSLGKERARVFGWKKCAEETLEYITG